jgi:hypothetical protein
MSEFYRKIEAVDFQKVAGYFAKDFKPHEKGEKIVDVEAFFDASKSRVVFVLTVQKP